MEAPYTPGDLVDHEGIAAVIRDAQGHILMQDHVKYGFWTIPVGKVEAGQSVYDALVQEVEEECGIRVLAAHQLTKKEYTYVRNDKVVRMVANIFVVDRWSGVPENREPHKHRDQRFLDIEEILRLPYLSDASLLFLKTIGHERPPKIDESL